MTPEMQKFIELLESHLGYSEKASGYTKFGEWYGKNVEFDADYSAAPWCEMYLSWAAHKLGYEEWIGQFAWTVAHAKWFKEQGAWGKTPKPGAFVYYDWTGSNSIDRIDHVGIVTRVEGDTIHTIEGNIDGGVAKRKERDTSKVVGYGYPERIKTRLDEDAARQAEEAKKKAEEQASLPPGPGTDVGVLQMPDESLSTLIPQSEREEAGAQPPLAARPNPRPTTATKTDHATATAPTPTSSSPASAAGQGVKKGKHAKPSTADTTSVTAEPLPTHVDASATGPLPAIDSPTLIGSALVAALALLAVAKTRQNRLRTATASATASRPARPAHRRRRRGRRGPVEPAGTPMWTRHLLDTVAPTTGPERHPATANADLTAATGAVAASDAGLTTAAELITTTDAQLTASVSDAPRIGTAHAGTHAAGGADDRAARFGDRRRVAASGSGQVRRLLDSRPFDPFEDAAPLRARYDRTPDRHTADTGAYTPAFPTGFFDEPLDTGPFEPCWDTGPMQRIRDDEPPQVVQDPGAGALVVDTGPFQRIVIPGATSTFDAFAPAGHTAGFSRAGHTAGGGDILDSSRAGTASAYRGRRRRRESPAEERLAAFPADLPPRGRRHRELVGAGRTTGSGRGRHRA
ncbi:CHAP domain-containing protein [Nonomuraea sp. NPDC049480]|uniref:CHAP domain-containing protein n=1 Tax=Nonomuraea sp. NPDC049480 TaxID=3364353 RepID=UPI0037994C25